jgi:transposase
MRLQELSREERKLILDRRRKRFLAKEHAARNVEIIKARRKGALLKDIAKRFKLSPATVGYVVQRYEATRIAAGLKPEGLRGKNVTTPNRQVLSFSPSAYDTLLAYRRFHADNEV